MQKTIMHGITGKKHKYMLYAIRKTGTGAHNLAVKVMKQLKFTAYFITPGKDAGESVYGVYVR